MPIRSGSSSPSRANTDGSVAVYCDECGGFIGNSLVRIGHAVCAICARSLEGIPVPAQNLAEYRASKGGRRGDVSFVRVPQPQEGDAEPFSLRSLGSGIARAVGFAKPEVQELESVKTSKKKRRKPIFQMPDEDLKAENIGSMLDIDEALKPK